MISNIDNIIALRNNQEFTEEQVNKMKELFTDEDGDFDFTKFIPYPYPMFLLDLNDVILEKYSAFYNHYKDIIHEDTMQKILSDKNSIIEIGDIKIESSIYVDAWYEKNHPEVSKEDMLPNWYYWDVEHWGTKWNAYESDISKGCIFFQTAWNPITDELLLAIRDKMKEVLTEEQMKDLQYGFKPEDKDYYRMEDFADLKSVSK